MKRILVTGGGGFIGSHIVNELIKRGNEIVVLDNFIGGKKNIKYFSENIEIIEGDISNFDECNKATKDIDVVFHIAAHAAEGQSIYIPIFNLKTNLLGSLNLLVAAINNNVKDFVFTSSIAVYGNPNELPVKETSLLNPEDPYGITKVAFENYLRIYYDHGQINPYIVRFFNVYGPRQRMDDPYRGVVPIFINRCLKGKNPIIFGDGLQKRAFTYINDIVEPICNIINNKKLINNPINIGATKPYTIRELAEKIIKKINPSLNIDYIEERKGDVKETFCDVTKAKKLFGYEVKVDLDEGLDRTIEWAKEEGPQEFRYIEESEIEKLKYKAYKDKKL